MITGDGTIIWHPDKSVLLDCTIGRDCTIHAPVWIGDNVQIGDRCRIQAFVFLPDGVTLGNDVFVGPNVVFTNDPEPPSGRDNWLPIRVGDGAVIGAGCVIRAGVTIAPGARIGCGAVVTRDVPAGDWHVGVPAREIGRAFGEIGYRDGRRFLADET